jgi:hypothetical protein
MRRKALYLAALAAVVLAMAVPAAAAGSASTGSSLTLTLGPSCALGGSATYTWSGFGGAKSVVVDVYDSNAATHPVQETVVTHGASGSVTFTFDEMSGDNYTASASLSTKKGPADGSQQVKYGSAGCA